VKIVISGYGKMGKEVEKTALSRGHEILAKIDAPGDWQANLALLAQADVVINFSTPASVMENIRQCFDLHLPVVVGTTGWHEQTGQVKKWCAEEGQAIFTASNFSIGVNLLFSLTKKLAELLNRADNYEISLEEVHHIHKLDSPSGTAISLAEIILNGLGSKKQWVNRRQESPDELEIISVRENEVPGMHTITCESDTDKLIIKHEAKGREGFALGALLAAEWLYGRKGFFEMKDMLRPDQ
jgi:4-hydroxy-tetrahydrodipicolinate reductase